MEKGDKEKLQQSQDGKSTLEEEELDIDDRSLEIDAINSYEFNPRDFASSHVDPPGDVIKPDIDRPENFKMVEEQQKDEKIGKMKNRINKGTATKTEQTHYFETEDGLLYYLSQPDSDDPRLRIFRLYIHQEMENIVIKQYHDQLGHMALDKTYDSMRLKYFFPNMYRKLNSYIEKCVTHGRRNRGGTGGTCPPPPIILPSEIFLTQYALLTRKLTHKMFIFNKIFRLASLANQDSKKSTNSNVQIISPH